MDIVRLAIGEQASTDADCLRIEQQPDGSYMLTASALCAGKDEAESVSIVGEPMFATVDAAEAAGLAWAEDVGVEQLFVSVGTIERPLQLSEIDRPL